MENTECVYQAVHIKNRNLFLVILNVRINLSK